MSPLALDAIMQWTGTTVTLSSVWLEKEECGQKIRKMEHFVQCGLEHCIQTGMFKNG